VFYAAGMTNQAVWIEIQAGYRLPCPADCEKEVYDRMMHCWKDNPHERPTFRGLTTFFRKKSFAHGTIAPYEIAPPRLRGVTATLVEENSSRSAALIAEAVQEGKTGKKDKKKKKKEAEDKKGKKDKKARKNVLPFFNKHQEQPQSPTTQLPRLASYVDCAGKVRERGREGARGRERE
jgi:hypothetical protein